MLRSKAEYYYGVENKSCAEALLAAARDVYKINISDDEINMFTGFGGGMGCKSACGSLTGAIAILSKMYGHRDDIRAISASYVEAFKAEMKTESIMCGDLEELYRTPADRCVKTVGLSALALQKVIDHIEGRDLHKAPEGEGCTISPEDIKRVKGLGFLNHKGTNLFNGRIITRNGKITAAENMKIAEAAEKFGDGSLMMTTRLTVEVSGIHYDDIDRFIEFVGEAGLETGGTGNKVRPVVACKAKTCQYGNYDAYALSDEIHERFYKGYHNVILPHKFKIALGGCPNNCVKPNLNDIGIVGVRVPQYDPEKCHGCKVCQVETTCPIKVANVVDGKLVIDTDACNNCGRCVGKCPFHSIDEGQYGWKIYIGGRWGKRVSHGFMLNKVFTDKHELLDTVEKAILFFRSEGISGERLADTVERLGTDYVEAKLLSNEMLEKKAEILGLNVVGGGTC